MPQLKQLRRQIWIRSFPTVSTFVLQALRELLASYRLMFWTVVGSEETGNCILPLYETASGIDFCYGTYFKVINLQHKFMFYSFC